MTKNLLEGLFVNTHFFYKQHFYISNAWLKLEKDQADVRQHLEAELLIFENY